MPAGQAFKIDPMPRSAERDVDSFVHQPLCMQTIADAGLVEQVDGDGFKHASPDPAQDVFGTLVIDDDGLDAGAMQQLPEHQARRP